MALVEKNGKIVDFIETTGKTKRVEEYVASTSQPVVEKVKEEPKEKQDNEEEEPRNYKENRRR